MVILPYNFTRTCKSLEKRRPDRRQKTLSASVPQSDELVFSTWETVGKRSHFSVRWKVLIKKGPNPQRQVSDKGEQPVPVSGLGCLKEAGGDAYPSTKTPSSPSRPGLHSPHSHADSRTQPSHAAPEAASWKPTEVLMWIRISNREKQACFLWLWDHLTPRRVQASL